MRKRTVSPTSALLMLRDGRCFSGAALGSSNGAVGEVVFNTSMTGYQEILSDPSYANQMITFTYPHIGNVGTNDEDYEAARVFASGAIIREPSLLSSNHRNRHPFDTWLLDIEMTAIAGIDTRALTRHVRNHGSQDGAIIHYPPGELVYAQEQAQQLLSGFSGLKNTDLASVVSCRKPYQWCETSWDPVTGYGKGTRDAGLVVVYDFGVKHTILRLLADRGLRVQVVPATTPPEQVLAMNPGGVLLSNGPGDPEPCTYAIVSVKKLIQSSVPLFGICFGFQLLALALGGKTKKMKFGHHGANHPVMDIRTGQVFITSQNHSFEVLADSLDDTVEITHRSQFDNSLQGFRLNDGRIVGFQGHPEASPGPQDIACLFDQFTRQVHAKT